MRESSLLVTGSGAVTFTGPLTASLSSANMVAPTTSSTCTHGTYWRPPATGPPMPALKKGSIFSSAPPESESTTPVRFSTTRTPSSSAPRASASQSRDQLREKVVAGLARSTRRAARRPAARTSRPPEPDTSTRGRSSAGNSPRAATRLRVESTRESRISRLVSSDHRCAIISPSRCTTASRPRSASSGGRSASGSAQRLGGHAERLAGPLGVARERRDLVAALHERAHERAAEHAGRAGDRDPHQLTVARSTVG